MYFVPIEDDPNLTYDQMSEVKAVKLLQQQIKRGGSGYSHLYSLSHVFIFMAFKLLHIALLIRVQRCPVIN